MRHLTAMILLLCLTLPAQAEETLRIAVLRFGTVNWLMDTIKSRGLDKQNGFTLEVLPLAGKPATTIALQSGDADMIVTDWVWAMRQHQTGTPYRFLPYSRTLGAVMVSADAGIKDVCGLRDRRIGVVGGAIDKSWLVIQALAALNCDFDLVKESRSLFGAPPLMSRQLESGTVDAVSTYWHYAARLEAAGYARLIGVDQVLAQLGIEPAPPLIGFVWNPENLSDRPGLIDAFRQSVVAASEVLATDDTAWQALRPRMNVKSDVGQDSVAEI